MRRKTKNIVTWFTVSWVRKLETEIKNFFLKKGKMALVFSASDAYGCCQEKANMKFSCDEG